jgi:diguanylate cyclase (GGDEF)-like protein
MKREASPIAGDISMEDFMRYINAGVEMGAYSKKEADDIIASYERCRELHKRDGLTGLYRQEFVDPSLFREIVRMQKPGMEREERRKEGGKDYISVVFIDMDSFKPVNDTFDGGYEVGDAVLREFAKIMGRVFSRKTDSLYRRGGDEFVALLPYTDGESASELQKRLYERFERRKAAALRMLRNPDKGITSYLERKGKCIEDLRDVIGRLSFSSGVVSQGQNAFEGMDKKGLGECTKDLLIIAAERMENDKRTGNKGR